MMNELEDPLFVLTICSDLIGTKPKIMGKKQNNGKLSFGEWQSILNEMWIALAHNA